MTSKWLVLAVVALGAAAWPAGAGAQQAAPRRSRESRGFTLVMRDHQGRIGVVIRTDVSPETDKVGAKIEGVTPGGPAEKAGLKVGDVITKFNGTALAGLPSDDDEESGPGHRLIELAHKLEPGDTVQVEYRRASEAKKATLVAEDLGSDFRFAMPPMPDMPLMPEMHGALLDRVMVCTGEVWCDFELVALNPDLGEYFGTKEGLLVVKAPGDSTLPLRGGDVILAIGGRKPSSPSHAMRILRSYDEGETVAIDVLRKEKRLSLSWRVPARGGEPWKVRRHGGREEQSRFWPPSSPRPHGARV
jgi:PDZ domain